MDLIIIGILFFSTLALFVLLLKPLSSNLNKSNGKLPPGKFGLPFFGETSDFLSNGKNATLEKFVFSRAKKYSTDTFKTAILGERIFVFCGAAGNKFLFSNENKYVKIWWPKTITRIFFTSTKAGYQEESMALHKRFVGVMQPESLQYYVGIMDSIAQKQMDNDWSVNTVVKASSLGTDYTFLVACRLILSMEDPKEIAAFAKPFHYLIAGLFSIPIVFPGTPYNRAIKEAKVINQKLLRMIQERKLDLINNKLSTGGNDILSHFLMTYKENGRTLDDAKIAESLLVLLFAGYDTTKSVIILIFKFLSQDPLVYDQVLKEQTSVAEGKKEGDLLNIQDIKKMKYTWNVVCEMLRLFPPLPGSFREAQMDFTYSGFNVPKGMKIYYSSTATHKDPKYFPEPERFDPSRFEGSGPPIPYSYIPFGGGPHGCPGKDFAKTQLLVFIHRLVTKFTWKIVDPNEPIEVFPVFKPVAGFPIHLYPK